MCFKKISNFSLRFILVDADGKDADYKYLVFDQGNFHDDPRMLMESEIYFTAFNDEFDFKNYKFQVIVVANTFGNDKSQEFTVNWTNKAA